MKENGFTLEKERSRSYLPQTIPDTDYTEDIAHLENTPTQAESQRHNQERSAGGIGLHVDTKKTEYMCFNQRGDIYALKGWAFETSGQVHLSRKQGLINRKWQQDATKKGIGSYQEAISDVEVKPVR